MEELPYHDDCVYELHSHCWNHRLNNAFTCFTLPCGRWPLSHTRRPCAGIVDGLHYDRDRHAYIAAAGAKAAQPFSAFHLALQVCHRQSSTGYPSWLLKMLTDPGELVTAGLNVFTFWFPMVAHDYFINMLQPAMPLTRASMKILNNQRLWMIRLRPEHVQHELIGSSPIARKTYHSVCAWCSCIHVCV